MSTDYVAVPKDVVRVVANHFRMSIAKLMVNTGNKQARPVLDARRVLMQLLHDECWLSWASVALFMNVASAGAVREAALQADRSALEACRKALRLRHEQRSRL